MKPTIVIITNSDSLSRSVNAYLAHFMDHGEELFFLTYGQNKLSRKLFQETDLFILGMLNQDDIGYRAEGLLAAMKWVQFGKRVLLLSGCVVADRLSCLYYWDLAATDSLHGRIQTLLRIPAPAADDFAALKEHFRDYIRPAVDRHRIGKD